MTKPSISGKSRYKQGIYVPQNPEKYVGDSEIRYRSGWEKRFMFWLDRNKSVVLWNSESCVVPYISPLDNRPHKYYVDFLAKMRSRDGTIKTYAIEIKPKSQCSLNRNTKNKVRLMEETKTFIVNKAKWEAATEYCKAKGIIFIILTEDDLGI